MCSRAGGHPAAGIPAWSPTSHASRSPIAILCVRQLELFSSLEFLRMYPRTVHMSRGAPAYSRVGSRLSAPMRDSGSIG